MFVLKNNFLKARFTTCFEKMKTIHRTAVPDFKELDGDKGEFADNPLSSDALRSLLMHAPTNIPVAVDTFKQVDMSKLTSLSIDSTEYIGNFIFENGRADKYLFPGGYYSFTSTSPSSEGSGEVSSFYYYLTDHLGNNRVVVNDNGDIEQTTHYYPFGAVYADAGKSPDFQKFKYTGKELDLTHGLNTYDHGARQNYSILGVWDRIDPMAEKYYNISPYSICGNNPCVNIDPTGKIKISAFKPGYDSNNGENNDALIQTVLEYNDENKDVIHFFCHGYQDGLDMQLIKEPGYHIFKKVEDARNYTYADCKLNSQDNYLGDVIIAILIILPPNWTPAFC